MPIFSSESFNLKGEPVDTHDAAETTGIYASTDGVRHFIKAGKPVPADWTLAEPVQRLNARPEVLAAQDDSEPPSKGKANTAPGGRKKAVDPKNKADSVPENKGDVIGTDDVIDGDD